MLEAELISQKLAAWAEEHKVELAFIQPGKPAQNAYIERFNRMTCPPETDPSRMR